jgi:hypothetical protein
MTDPLGQSQVLPYLFGLVKMGHQITLLSFEKKDRFEKQRNVIESSLQEHNIQWNPLSYTATPPIISSIKDFRRMKKTAAFLHQKNGFHISHCRGYLPAMCGNYLKKRYGIKLLFDMRGFWPDERVEGGIWNKKNPVFKIVYNYFKRQEKKLFKSANAVVSLTHAGKKIIEKWPYMQSIKTNISVIPCCADFNHFTKERIDTTVKEQLKQELKIGPNDFIISYLGSIGSWYMLPEMLDFFKVFLKNKPESKMLFISRDNPEMIYKEANEKNIERDKIIIRGATRELVPTLLSLSNVSLFFIKPVYSKQASSPTKLAEILGMEIPVIANAGVGDVDELFNKYFPDMLVKEFNESSYQTTIDNFLNKKIDKAGLREISKKYFSLEDGITTYAQIYDQL